MAGGTDPSKDNIDKRDGKNGSPGPSERDPLMQAFETDLLSGKVILPDTLSNLTPAQLPQALDLAISDDTTLKTFRESLRALCEDPHESLEGFRNNICTALTREIRENCLENPIAACGPLTRILDVALTTVASISDNPANGAPHALTSLIDVLVDVVDKLRDYRTGSTFTFDGDDLVKRLSHDELITMWDLVNTKVFHVLNRGLRIGGYEPPPLLLDACADQLGALMASVAYGMGPLQSESAVEAQAWAQTLRLAATLGKVGSDQGIEVNREAIEKVARELVLWKQGELIHEFKEPKLMREMHDHIEKCEHYALRALFACKPSEGARSVWNQVVREYPTTCTPYRMALFSLAKFELSAARLPVVRILKELAVGRCTEWEQGRHLDTIVQFLEFPGAEEVLESAFDTTQKRYVPVEYQENVREQLRERYTRHVEAFPGAQQRLRGSESKHGESTEVIRSSEAKKGVIWNVTARKALERIVKGV